MSTPHITELLDLTPALDAALYGMTVAELKDRSAANPTEEAAELLANTDPVERRAARAAVMAAVYPAARLIAEQAYARAWDRARALVDERTGEADDTLGTLDGVDTPLPDGHERELNPFAEGAVIV